MLNAVYNHSAEIRLLLSVLQAGKRYTGCGTVRRHITPDT